ncbi:MAG TPA: prephenate dehydrogenase/arogenate dehydrogenase family protein [Candidatus Saccharimonadales bacterium]|jgi:prephenate dehydrogenase|nr:prephenate dehydrogenase/arogenate dehydrogenase family protein [Candidatus Saccharimonadales bacterium]
MAASFRRAAILGTGLIGGSFALALRKYFPKTEVVGWDKQEVLNQALERNAIKEGFADLPTALEGAELIYIALPVGHTIELLPEIGRLAPRNALVTDACSTKRSVCAAAVESFREGGAQFLGGHPMAGKEISGIASADANLFRGSKYALIPTAAKASDPSKMDSLAANFVVVIEKFGAEPMWLAADVHDRAAAVISHLPQLLSVALAGVVRKQTDESGLPVILAGRGLRDALRLAGSPYSVWRDIILTNSDNLEQMLDQMIQALEQVRGELRTRALEEEFSEAGELYKILRDMK